MSVENVTRDLERYFRPYLFSSERLLWCGQPKQGLAFIARDIFLIPFSLLWCGIVLLSITAGLSESGEGPPLFVRIFGLTFLAVGLYFVVGRFLHDAYVRKNTRYAVTDQRILVLRGSKITSLDIKRLPRLGLAENRDGSGTLAFEAAHGGPWGGMNGFSWWVPSLSSGVQFFRIDAPRRVYELVRKAAVA